MLEKIDVNRTIEKTVYKQTVEQWAPRLSLAQRKLKQMGVPIIVVFEGIGAAGKGVQINRLIQALDPRGFDVYSNNRLSEEDTLRPFLWHYWTQTPENGRIAVFDGSWYRRVLQERFEGQTKAGELATSFQDISAFERQLTDGGTAILKFFLYIDKDEQKKRYKKLTSSKETAWRVTDKDWERNKGYDEYLHICEETLEKSDFEFAPWNIIEATDKNYASLKILHQAVDFFEAIAAKNEAQSVAKSPTQVAKGDGTGAGDQSEARYKNGVLSGVDLTKKLEPGDYKKRLGKLQKRLEILHSEIYRLRIPVVLGFEGWDAAGKGGAIKRLTSCLDPRGYKVCPTSAANDIERKHNYLWRFWNKMPKAGHIAIFDRTWYGRVMVERLEGFCTEAEWKRAYQEINETELHMANAGAIVLKFWLHIDKDEQERRFNERMNTPAKQWKITDEDWRNRAKWDSYEIAVNEMLVRTSTTYAPWIVVEGNCKRYARVKVLETVVDAIEKRVKEAQG